MALLAVVLVGLTSCSYLPSRSALGGDSEVASLIAEAPGADYYPDADVIVLLDEARVEVFPDGRSRTIVHWVSKIVSQRGKARADCSIGFNSRTQTIRLLGARTITPKGRILPLKKKAIKVVTPFSRYPAYSDYKRLQFSMPGATVGSVIEYRYILKDIESAIPGHFADDFMLQWYDPIVVCRYTVSLPATLPLHYRMCNPVDDTSDTPAISEQGDRAMYRWEYRNVPQILDEEFKPPMEDIVPTILVTSVDSWDVFFDWWRGCIAGKTEPDAAIRDKARELTRGITDSNAKITALFDYVKREIRYVSIGMGKTGYEPERASEVFENKYGDCKDKSTLLISMLRSVGISAHYVLISTTDQADLNVDFPYPFQFNHCIVAVEASEGFRFLDPVAEDYRSDYLPGTDQNRKVLIFAGGDTVFGQTPVAPPRRSGVHTKQVIDIRP
jgi:hypothetical protein